MNIVRTENLSYDYLKYSENELVDSYDQIRHSIFLHDPCPGTEYRMSCHQLLPYFDRRMNVRIIPVKFFKHGK